MVLRLQSSWEHRRLSGKGNKQVSGKAGDEGEGQLQRQGSLGKARTSLSDLQQRKGEKKLRSLGRGEQR